MEKLLEIINSLEQTEKIISLSEYCQRVIDSPAFKQLQLVVSNSSSGVNQLKKSLNILLSSTNEECLNNNIDQKIVLCLLVLADHDMGALTMVSRELHGSQHFWSSCVVKSLILSKYVSKKE